MKVLVIVPTYGRIPFLNRVVAGFLSQDYDDKELVIVNDDKNIQICCEIKNVICINLNKKILVGKKRNLAVNVGFYDLYLLHDDDDIFLPTRISDHVKIYKENSSISACQDMHTYIIYGGLFDKCYTLPSCISFTKEAWFKAKGYELDYKGPEDREFASKLNLSNLENENNPSYIYNFSGVNYHLSGTSDERIEKIAYDQLIKMNLLDKKYYIEPDFNEYNKFIKLAAIYKEKQLPFRVKHNDDYTIEIL